MSDFGQEFALAAIIVLLAVAAAVQVCFLFGLLPLP